MINAKDSYKFYLKREADIEKFLLDNLTYIQIP